MNAGTKRGLLAILLLSIAAALPAATFVDQLGAAVRDGNVDLTFALLPGKVPLTPGWSIETSGSPRARLKASAREGRIDRLAFEVRGGNLIVAGTGLRPDVVIESLEADGTRGVTNARFHGKGFFGRIVIGLFRGAGMSAVRKMKFRTDLPSVLRGDIFVSEAKPAGSGAPPTPTPAPAAPPPPAPPATPGPSLFDLVETIEIGPSSLSAYPGRELSIEPLFHLETAATGEAVRLAIAHAVYRPERAGVPSRLDLEAELEGAFGAGGMAYEGERLAFSSAALRKARVEVRSDPSGKSRTSLAAERIDLDLSSGRFTVPGGIRVAVEAPSRFAAGPLRISEEGKVSGVFDLDLRGKTGEWKQNGVVAALNGVELAAKGLRVEQNSASGEVDLAFDYRVVYPFTVAYPVREIAPRKVDLNFAGPLRATLILDRAGDPSGSVAGTYVLKVPWPPIEQAAFEAIRARWTEDIRPIRKVEFSLSPSRFAPCGESCFVAAFQVTAEKKSGKRSLFRAECAPEGKANLVIDKERGTLSLKDLKVEPHCAGLAGKLVNLIAPLFARAYGDVTLFQLPPDAPLTIDAVKSGMAWIELSGRIRWSANAPTPASGPSPAKP